MSQANLDFLREKLSGGRCARLVIAEWIESRTGTAAIVAVILVNAVVLGLLALPSIDLEYGHLLRLIDYMCLVFFIIEIGLKGFCYRLHLFRDGWNVFDILVIAIALVPTGESLSVLRSMRVLRVLRLMTALPQLQRVVAAFLHAIPGLGSVVSIMAILVYVSAVMATGFFGEAHPELFGNLWASLYTLFQIMTLESWSMGVVRPVMETHWWAWMFFLPYIMLATFTVLNLFIGIIVSTMQELRGEEVINLKQPVKGESRDSAQDILQRIEADLASLRESMKTDKGK